MKLKKRALLFVSLFVFLAVSLWATWRIFRHQLPTYGFNGTSIRQVAGCSQELPYGLKPRVKSFSVNDGQLRAFVLANGNCSPLELLTPSARVDGSKAVVSWSWTLAEGAEPTGCYCTRHLDFRAPIGGQTVTTVEIDADIDPYGWRRNKNSY